MPKIAVTGVTGNLGGMVSRLCKKNGIEVRNLARNVEKAKNLDFLMFLNPVMINRKIL